MPLDFVAESARFCAVLERKPTWLIVLMMLVMAGGIAFCAFAPLAEADHCSAADECGGCLCHLAGVLPILAWTAGPVRATWDDCAQLRPSPAPEFAIFQPPKA